MSECRDNLIAKHPAIIDIAANANCRFMYLFQPVLHELFDCLLRAGCKRSLLVCILHSAQLHPGFLLSLSVDVPALPIPGVKASYPSIILLVKVDRAFAFAAPS